MAKHLVETYRAIVHVNIEENGGRNAVDLAACKKLIHFLTQQESLESGHQCTLAVWLYTMQRLKEIMEVIDYLVSEWRVITLSKDKRGKQLCYSRPCRCTKPLTAIAGVEPPAKTLWPDELRVVRLHSSQDLESRPVLVVRDIANPHQKLDHLHPLPVQH